MKNLKLTGVKINSNNGDNKTYTANCEILSSKETVKIGDKITVKWQPSLICVLLITAINGESFSTKCIEASEYIQEEHHPFMGIFTEYVISKEIETGKLYLHAIVYGGIGGGNTEVLEIAPSLTTLSGEPINLYSEFLEAINAEYGGRCGDEGYNTYTGEVLVNGIKHTVYNHWSASGPIGLYLNDVLVYHVEGKKWFEFLDTKGNCERSKLINNDWMDFDSKISLKHFKAIS